MAKLSIKKTASKTLVTLTLDKPWIPYSVQKGIDGDVKEAVGGPDDGSDEYLSVAQAAVNLAVEEGMIAIAPGISIPEGSDLVKAVRIRRHGGRIGYALNTGGFGGQRSSVGLADKLKAKLA